MWLLLSRVILPSVSPEAPSVFSLTLGTCCLKTSGVSLRGERRRWAPRPGPQASTDGASDASDASATAATTVHRSTDDDDDARQRRRRVRGASSAITSSSSSSSYSSYSSSAGAGVWRDATLARHTHTARTHGDEKKKKTPLLLLLLLLNDGNVAYRHVP